MNLQDLTAKELGIISDAIASQIEDLNAQIKAAEKYIPDYMVKEVTAKDREALPVLQDFHIQVLNAKSLVQIAENIHSN